MIKEWIVIEPTHKARHCIIALAGRGNSTATMAEIAGDLQLPNTLIVAMRPSGYAWYPMPNNSLDQEEAVAGLPLAVDAVAKRVKAIKSFWRLKNKDICLLGFSAGSVVSLQLALTTQDPFLAVMSFAGAILEPYNIPKSDGRPTEFLLQHNKDDACFDWWERYLPMREGLASQGYKTLALEKDYGHHQIMARDIVSASNHIGRLFGYSNWCHEEADKFRALPFKKIEPANLELVVEAVPSDQP